MTKPATFAATMMAHHAYSHGRDSLVDADLTQRAEMHPDLRAVFEEAQYLRAREDELEMEIARISD